ERRPHPADDGDDRATVERSGVHLRAVHLCLREGEHPHERRKLDRHRADERDRLAAGARVHAIAPSDLSCEISPVSNPQSASAASVCAPGLTGAPCTAVVLRLNRGAGAGWGAPSTSTNI